MQRDLQKRPTKDTLKKDLVNERDMSLDTYKNSFIYEKRPTKETYKENNKREFINKREMSLDA